MLIPALTATIYTDRRVHANPGQLRGFFGWRHPESVLLHQHCGNNGDNRYAYLYPRVQYRVRQGTPVLIGIAEGTTAVLEATSALQAVDLAGQCYAVQRVVYSDGMFDLSEEDASSFYRFTSPWLALNQKNFAVYQEALAPQRIDLLQRVLVGNVLSMCKSLDIQVTERLRTTIDLRPVPVCIKNQRFLGFIGDFSINFHLCPGLGRVW